MDLMKMKCSVKEFDGKYPRGVACGMLSLAAFRLRQSYNFLG
jgi:hypothetical protein